jgi:23S rRNA (guanine2445-N2)-methyltransferase / 23S rRNA (guanine2069-N7)-methyltransferase
MKLIVFIVICCLLMNVYSLKNSNAMKSNAMKSNAMKNNNARSFFVTTVPGLESVLLNEIKQLGINFNLGITNLQKGRAGVHFDTDNERAPIELTLWLRSSLKLMEKLVSGKNIIRKRDLYDLVDSFDWTKVIDDKHTIKCDCIIGDNISNELNNSHFTSLTVKNCIVDQIREKNGGTRPSVSVDDPDLVALVYIHKDEATCYRVWSGNESMHKRGYRQDTIHKAALRETTAAALLLASGFNAAEKQVLVDPMTGSGTLLLEASLMLSNTAPGLLYCGHSNAEISPDFAPPKYMTWLDNCNNIDLWDEIWTKTNVLDRRKELNEIGEPLLFGNDIHHGAIELATASSKKLGVSNIISWSNQDISSYKQPRKANSIITNPPWNLRLNEGAEESWLKLSSFINNADCDNIWTLTGNPELVISLKQQGLQPTSQVSFSASGTEMRFIKYNKVSA